jgi:hypothetical protein
VPEREIIGTIRARTIEPDGSIVEFDGQVFEKTIVKTKGVKYLAKTFTLPDVQVGSVIEYYFTRDYSQNWIFFSNWVLSNELFTKQAKFSLRPFHNDYAPLSFRWTEHLPPGSPEPKQGSDDIVRLEGTNIPAFPTEDFMPPANELMSRVDFIYSRDPFELDANKYWKKVGKKRSDQMESFAGKRSMKQAVVQIVSASDSPEAKLQKIYARVQQLRNTSYEIQKTEEEKKREKEKPADNVGQVWERGYGDRTALNWLFLALVRAAGLEAYGVWASDRRNYFFNPQAMNSGQLDSSVVLVKLNGKDLYFEPGAAFAPFGLLRWEETGVQGLRMDKDGGTWVQTALPDSSASRVERKASLKLLDKGDLEGKLTVTFTGLESLRRRVDERNEDGAARKKFLEDEVKEFISVGSEVELSSKPEWSNSASPLVAEFNVKIPGWASMAGSRMVVPVGIFSGTERHLFVHSNRVHPVYFEFLSEKLDDVSIELPSGWKVGSLPPPQNQDLRVVAYAFGAENNKGTLHLTRKLDINIGLVDVKFYLPLRSFFQTVKTGDEEQIVLQPVTAGSAHP